jgi:hypothetical protein
MERTRVLSVNLCKFIAHKPRTIRPALFYLESYVPIMKLKLPEDR